MPLLDLAVEEDLKTNCHAGIDNADEKAG